VRWGLECVCYGKVSEEDVEKLLVPSHLPDLIITLNVSIYLDFAFIDVKQK
jgi:hypothetical protein